MQPSEIAKGPKVLLRLVTTPLATHRLHAVLLSDITFNEICQIMISLI